MRILGIDPGERRIGLAISDELGITAQGLDTFDRRAGQDFLIFVGDLVRTRGIEEIVVGDPVQLSGKRGEGSLRARAMAEELQRETGVPVRLWDERLSSEEARRTIRSAGGGKRRKGVVDRLAAVLILQSYLDRKRRED